ncbi:hypothetical protein UVI_02042830 [Ustilaginoidea virens]|uniref:Cyclin-D1-binding protein 1-like N-terminal domain-containing protein n=1 Tax=Ustilaginoidea virens TaxID=1159556 RepID=A0A1B5L3K7_USTVR|nr:hypothetical protein UVI_02042830 [Ustilaginoidea virens]
MPSVRRDDDAIKSLDSLVQTAASLLSRLQAVLLEIQKSPASSPASSPSPAVATDAVPDARLHALALAHDSASLIRAHGTKISLLVINEPFTPAAVSAVLGELAAGPVPALVSSVQACTSHLYTEAVRKELAGKANRVLSELRELLKTIPRHAKVLPGSESPRRAFSPPDRGSLPATGLLWSACDDVVNLSKGGVGGFFVQRVRQWKDTLCDITQELKDWGDEEPDDGDDDDDHDDHDDDHDDDDDDDEPGQCSPVHAVTERLANSSLSTQAILDQLMSSHQTIPRSDPDRIRPRLETSLKRLRLVTLLYQALTKRRLRKLPPLPPGPDQDASVAPRLDAMARALAKLPETFGDLACAFYELAPGDIDAAMDQSLSDALAATELLANDWQGGRDGFSDWTDKFRVEIDKM